MALTLEAYETYCRISISDTGRDVQAVDGVGLGLPLARKIVQAQGGWIKVTSDHSGSQFSILLPHR